MKYYKQKDGVFGDFKDVVYRIQPSRYTSTPMIHFYNKEYGWSALLSVEDIDASYVEISEQEAEEMLFLKEI